MRVSAPLYVRGWRAPNNAPNAQHLTARAATHSCRRRRAALRQKRWRKTERTRDFRHTGTWVWVPGHARARPRPRSAPRARGVFSCEAPVARWHLPSVLPGVILTSLGIVDATRKQDLSAFCRAHLLPAVAIVVAASALGSRLGRRGRGSRLMRLCPLTP